jgi:hypothetical protein
MHLPINWAGASSIGYWDRKAYLIWPSMSITLHVGWFSRTPPTLPLSGLNGSNPPTQTLKQFFLILILRVFKVELSSKVGQMAKAPEEMDERGCIFFKEIETHKLDLWPLSVLLRTPVVSPTTSLLYQLQP